MTHDSYDDDPIEAWRGLRLGSTLLRAALLFSSAGIAFALILTPLADRFLHDDDSGPYGLDHAATGSIDRSVGYTVRRGVVQEKGGTCIIRADGRSFGNC